jgi:integrase
MVTFMAELAPRVGYAARALEFLILTASRTNEVINATWDEVDLNTAVWTIPAERMKARKEHRVPLSERAASVLSDLPRDGDYIFPGPNPAKPISNMAMAELLKRMGRTGITVHGFRSSFRDWAAERTTFPNHVVEMALAHTVKNRVEAAYRRGDLFDKRKHLMSQWAAFCETKHAPKNVVTFDRIKRPTTSALDSKKRA